MGIPTLLYRVIQQAIAQVLSPVYEPTFSDNSYGFRPGRRARQAIEEMQKEGNKRRPKCHVVDCDLQQFFDTVDHRKLMERLRESVREHRLMGLIAKFLKAGVRPDQSPVRGQASSAAGAHRSTVAVLVPTRGAVTSTLPARSAKLFPAFPPLQSFEPRSPQASHHRSSPEVSGRFPSIGGLARKGSRSKKAAARISLRSPLESM